MQGDKTGAILRDTRAGTVFGRGKKETLLYIPRINLVSNIFLLCRLSIVFIFITLKCLMNEKVNCILKKISNLITFVTIN